MKIFFHFEVKFRVRTYVKNESKQKKFYQQLTKKNPNIMVHHIA